MAIIVNTNMSALKTRTNLNNATNGLTNALERMSTGYKINSAKDDAAGLYVATGLKSQINGSKIAQTNVETGNNILQTVEGDLDTMLENLNRIRDLATQAANSVYSEESLNSMKAEVDARIAEINRVSLSSNFNGLKLLDGTNTALVDDGLRLQVGANADATANAIFVTGVFAKTDATTLGTSSDDTTNPGVGDFAGLSIADGAAWAFKNASAASQYIASIDSAINTISSNKSAISFSFQPSI